MPQLHPIGNIPIRPLEGTTSTCTFCQLAARMVEHTPRHWLSPWPTCWSWQCCYVLKQVMPGFPRSHTPRLLHSCPSQCQQGDNRPASGPVGATAKVSRESVEERVVC